MLCLCTILLDFIAFVPLISCIKGNHEYLQQHDVCYPSQIMIVPRIHHFNPFQSHLFSAIIIAVQLSLRGQF